MADKVALVRLRAQNDQYDKAMDRSKGKTEALAKSAPKFDALGTKLTTIGSTLTRNVTLPLVAVGGVASKMSVDFERVFGQMQGLAGVTADEVDGLKSAVLDLAGETGKAPQELAEALYFVRSAGIDGQDALDALEVSAKGAAAGLGEAAVVADAVTSAMNAYGPAVVSAADATDVLVATAREGKAEAAQLAPQFGRLLPVAAELGIRFDEVGAGLAFLSRSSGSAELSATQLSGVMAKLLKPSLQGAEALEEVGLSADGIRESIQDQGLLATLQMLRDRLGDSGFNRFFDDIQGLQGALILTGNQAEEARGVFDALEDSTGALSEAFDAAASRDGFKMEQALAQLQAAMIQIGDVIVPLVADFAAFASTVIGAFTSLPEPIQKAIIMFGGLVAAVGPLMSIGGRLLKSWDQIGRAIDKIAIGAFNASGNLKSLARTMGTGAAAIGTGAAAWSMWNSMMDESTRKGADAVQSLRDQFNGLDPASMSMERLRGIIGAMDGDLESLSNTIEGSQAPWDADKRAEMKAQREEGEKLRGEWKQLETAAAELAAEMGISTDEALRSILANENLTAAAADTTEEFDTQAAAVQATADALQGYLDQLAATFDPLFGAQDALLGVEEAQRAATEAVNEYGEGSAEAQAANRDAVRAAVEYESAMGRLAQAVATGDVKLEDATATLQGWVAQGLITEQQAGEAAYAFAVLKDKADAVPDRVGITATANTSQASAALDALARQALAVAGRVTSTIIMAPFGGRRGATGGLVPHGLQPVYRAEGGPIFRPIGTDTIPAMLSEGEFVMRRSAVDKYGAGFMEALNSGRMFAASGGVTVVNQQAITIGAGADTTSIKRVVADAIAEGTRRGISAGSR